MQAVKEPVSAWKQQVPVQAQALKEQVPAGLVKEQEPALKELVPAWLVPGQEPAAKVPAPACSAARRLRC